MKLSTTIVFSALLVCAGSVGVSSVSAAEPASLKPTTAMQKVCFDCHAGGTAEGSFDLEKLLAGNVGAKERGQWLKVWRNVRHEFMPPAEGEKLSAEERRAMGRWIEREIFNVDHERPDPGIVTIRRLNRSEYNFTINDLFGVELSLKDKLPPDDTAFGFENIGDAQTLSPPLLSRFLDLADFVVSQTILENGRPLPRIPVKLKVAKAEARSDDQTADIEIAHDGRYKLSMEFALGGWQDFGGDYRVTLTVDNKPIIDETVPLGGDSSYDYTRELDLAKGKHTVALKIDPLKPELVANAAAAKLATELAVEPAKETAEKAKGNTPEEAGKRRRGPRVLPPVGLNMKRLNVAFTGPIDAGIVAEYPEPHRKIFFRGDAPADAAGRETYARDILRTVASRAFRRPIDDGSLTRLTKIALRDNNFERGVGQAIAAILSSPRFLFREEPQPEPDNPRASHKVDDYALASRLSYLFWLSIPDAELNELAAKGELRANLNAQVSRMLAEPKSKRFFEDFTGQWLRTRNVLMSPIAPERTSKEVDPVRAAMKQETDLLFENICREDRDLLELITANYSYLNEGLAAYYGVPGVKGNTPQKVEFAADSHRGGLLTHGSFLIATSNPNRTSPVKRGVFVLENIFGTPPPPPPPDIPSLEEAKKAGVELKTLRDQLAAHRENKSCAACHAHFDSIGLALENFSYVGQWRDKDGDVPVDASGKLVTGESFASFDELRNLIATRKDKYYRSVTEHLMTYALGRGLEPYDAVTVDNITDKLVADGGKFSTLITQLVESPAFQSRRGEGEAASP